MSDNELFVSKPTAGRPGVYADLHATAAQRRLCRELAAREDVDRTLWYGRSSSLRAQLAARSNLARPPDERIAVLRVRASSTRDETVMVVAGRARDADARHICALEMAVRRTAMDLSLPFANARLGGPPPDETAVAALAETHNAARAALNEAVAALDDTGGTGAHTRAVSCATKTAQAPLFT